MVESTLNHFFSEKSHVEFWQNFWEKREQFKTSLLVKSQVVNSLNIFI